MPPRPSYHLHRRTTPPPNRRTKIPCPATTVAKAEKRQNKSLLATTILVGTAGFAAAEVTLSGSAVMGVGSDGTNTISKMETYVTFTGAGETDGGLSFGLSSTQATYDTDGGFSDDGTSVFISGAFGKLSMGSVGEADEVATLSDIGGINGLGVDNLAESFSGDSAGRPSHDINYTYSADAFTVAVSTHLGAEGEGDSYAVGGKYSFGDFYVGAGYSDNNEVTFLDVDGVGVDDGASEPATDGTVTSLYAGGTFGAAAVAAMYSSWEPANGADSLDSYGVHVAYTMDALTVSAEYADSDLADEAAYGLGAAYDLGGGASVTGGVASVEDETVWEAGVSMSF